MDNKKSKILTIFLSILVFILILIIIFMIFDIKKLEEKPKPTGNVDIFEIECDDNCDCKDNETDKEDEAYNNENQNYESVFKDDEDKIIEELEEGIKVTDNEKTWKSSNKLNIFENPVYEDEKKIAPESTNIYQFVIKNNTVYDVKYNLSFEETNKDKINMKYRLSKNGNYVVGSKDSWVTYDKLKIESKKLLNKINDTYYLEWKWFSSENDTEIGSKGNANYTLSIKIDASQINE